MGLILSGLSEQADFPDEAGEEREGGLELGGGCAERLSLVF